MTNDLKLKIYPAVIAVLGLGLVALLLSRVEIQVANQSPLDRSPLDRASDLAPSQPDSSIARSPSPQPSVALPPPVTAPLPSPAAAPANVQGGLRVSNQTDYPVRVALLYQQASPAEQPQFTQPVHWDFAPEEGAAKGLIMSLPSGGLKLSSGDVLVAFAQDGSRRYWGPYVVGKTELPTWNSEQQAWILSLQP